MKSIETIVEFGQQHQELEAGCESDAALKQFEIGIVEMLRELTGLKIDGGAGSMGSRYYDIFLEDGSIEFRISNHKQRYSGPVWSFDAGDDARMIQLGIDTILVEVKDRVNA